MLDDLAVLPWPVGLGFGLLGFLVIHHGIPAFLSRQGGPLTQGLAQSFPFPVFAWLFLALCAMAAFASFLGARRKRRLLDTRTGLYSIAALDWRDFERLVGEAFRRQGYTVEETGLGGADGGIDLILRRDGKRTLVQCKHWKREKVGVSVVREMYGLLAHHGAADVSIATMGGFTPDAAQFAQGKPITLVDGDTFLAMLRAAQSGDAIPAQQQIEPAMDTAVSATPSVPDCPSCGARMVGRKNRQNGILFWGCSTYPKCKGTR